MAFLVHQQKQKDYSEEVLVLLKMTEQDADDIQHQFQPGDTVKMFDHFNLKEAKVRCVETSQITVEDKQGFFHLCQPWRKTDDAVVLRSIVSGRHKKVRDVLTKR